VFGRATTTLGIGPHSTVNLECRSEMCGTRLAENTGRKKLQKIRHLGIIARLCRAVSSQLKHVSIIGEILLSSNISSTCSHNVENFGPLMVEIGLGVFATPQQISTGFVSCLRYCSNIAQWRPIKLCTVFGRLLHWYTTLCSKKTGSPNS